MTDKHPREHCRDARYRVVSDRRTLSRHDATHAAGTVLFRWRTETGDLPAMLADRLGDGAPAVRADAACLLAAIGPPAAEYADRLAALLPGGAPPPGGEVADRSVPVGVVIWALARFGDPRCVAPLAQWLAGTGPTLPGWRCGSIGTPSVGEILASLPEHADALLPGVRHRLRVLAALDFSETPAAHNLAGSSLRDYVAALGAWGQRAAAAVPELIGLLAERATGPVGLALDAAVDALGAIGRPAAAAEPELRRLASQPGRVTGVHVSAALAHYRVSGEAEPALAVLDKAFHSVRHPAEPAGACRMAAELGPLAGVYRDALHALLPTTPEAAHALWRVTRDPTDAVTALGHMIEAASADGVRRWTGAAARLLAAIEPIGIDGATRERLAAALLPTLRRLLADERRLSERDGWAAVADDEETRRHLAAAVSRWSGTGTGAAPPHRRVRGDSAPIVDRLRSPEPTRRVSMLSVLITHPDPRTEVVAELERLCADRTCACLAIPYLYGEIRLLAAEALAAARAVREDFRPVVLAVPRAMGADRMEPFRVGAGIASIGGPRPLEAYRLLRDGGHLPVLTFRFDPRDYLEV